jgi:hypothetical protein
MIVRESINLHPCPRFLLNVNLSFTDLHDGMASHYLAANKIVDPGLHISHQGVGAHEVGGQSAGKLFN